jgi:hypothetical protein
VEGGSFTGDFERYVKEGSGHYPCSLRRGFTRGTGKVGGVYLLGTLREMSGKALEGEQLSLYKGPMRTWREGSHTEDSTCNRWLWKRGISFCRGSVRGTERYLAREGSANMFIWPQPVLDIFFCYV